MTEVIGFRLSGDLDGLVDGQVKLSLSLLRLWLYGVDINVLNPETIFSEITEVIDATVF